MTTLVGLLGVSAISAAAPYKQGDRVLDVQLLRPGVAPDDFLNIRGSRLPKHGDLALGAHLIYMRRPLATDVNGTEQVIVRDQAGWELSASIGLWDRFAAGLAVPVSLLQACPSVGDASCQGLGGIEVGQQSFDGGGFGDLRLSVRAQLLNPSDDAGLGLGLGLTVTLPTGNATAFVGEGSLSNLNDPESGDTFRPTGLPYLVADYRFTPRLRFAANAGYLIRRDAKFQQITIADQLLYGVAAAYRATPMVEAIAEVDGRMTPSDAARRNNPHEVRLAARLNLGAFRVTAGGGLGINGDYGAPDLRLLAGLVYTGKVGAADRDDDGVRDYDDKCIDRAEDRDGFADDDGCPEIDNDEDGIPDALDRCPNVAAVTADGCPLGDSDKDGLADDLDACPNQAEDKDGFQDEDGCPDPDNDADGIPDAKDACPLQAETLNTYKDEDGCPDEAPAIARPTVAPTKTLSEIPYALSFATSRLRLNSDARAILARVASLLRRNPAAGVIRIEGHSDPRDRRALESSQQRADLARRHLIKAGVSAGRLQAVGYGGKRPVASSKSEEGRRKNRRVEFIIVEY